MDDSLEKIGVLCTVTKDFHFAGKPFSKPEDFIVEEITSGGKALSTDKTNSTASIGEKKDFLVFTLVKKGLSTQEAIRKLSRQLNISIKRFGYCGNKDKRAITAQRLSVFKLSDDKLSINDDNMFLKDAEYSDRGCKIGDLYGNHFTIKISDFAGTDEDIEEFTKQMKNGFPNFFGPQRFGSSSLNIEISKKALQKDFKGAIESFLVSARRESPLASSSRQKINAIFTRLQSDGADKQAISDKQKIFNEINELPGFMFSEKTVLIHLLEHRNDFIGAFRTVPKYFRLLILQAYQSYLFNIVLSKAIKGKLDVVNLPTIGYDLNLESVSDERLRNIISETMSAAGVTAETFLIKPMPELSLKTFDREAFCKPEDLSYQRDGTDLILSFSLKKGQYATSLLIEMFKTYLF